MSTFSHLAGEYYVAAKLQHRGLHAAITLGNAKTIDILAANQDGSKSASLQVKTTESKVKRDGTISWQLNKKGESLLNEKLFYVFVHLINQDEQPVFYIVPSRVVADYITTSHRIWLASPGKNGRIHIDTDIRIFDLEVSSEYREAWSLLGLD
jgi:hypothetical protein